MDKPNEAGAPSSNSGGQDRLDSWKEIAAYLKRDVTTVYRWEKNEGLPVHRHLHGEQATVYAYRSEIDRWLATRGETRRSSNGNLNRTRKSAWVATLGIAALILTFSVWWVAQSPPSTVKLDFEADWILITDFDNQTGNPVLDDLVEDALARQLSESPSLNVVPRDRINETLALMRRPADVSLDLEIGWEVAQREGYVPALLVGRAANVAGNQMLTFEVIDVWNGTVVAAAHGEIEDEARAVTTIQDVSARIREVLEQRVLSIAQPEVRLERVTTDSLKALKFYSQATETSMGDFFPGRDLVTESLLREALANDEEFASAQILLAQLIGSRGRSYEEFVPYAESAFALAEMTSDRERHFIRGTYYDLIGDDEQAAEEYRILLHQYPDHFLGTRNLASLLRRGRGLQEEAGYSELAVAKRYWMDGNYPLVQDELNRLSATLSSIDDVEEREGLAFRLADLHLALGQIDQAEDLLAVGGFSSLMDAFVIPLGVGRPSRWVAQNGFPPDVTGTQAFRAIELARIGNTAEAELRLQEATRNRPPIPEDEDRFGFGAHGDRMALLAEGEILRARGEYDAAETLLTELLGRPALPINEMWRDLAAEALAELHGRRGDYQGAIQALETVGASDSRVEVGERTGFLGVNIVLWMRNRLKLAEMLRQVDPARAAGIESELRDMLTYADPDHFL